MYNKLYIFFIVVFARFTLLAQLPGYKWATAIGTVTNASSFSTGRDIVADLNSNVYILGYFVGTLDFDPGLGLQIKTSNGGGDVFLAKMDSSGNMLWVNCFGGVGTEIGNAITIGSNGDIYIAGYFEATVDFDPGLAAETKTALAQRDCFISKFDTAGNFVWVKCFEGTGDDEIISLALDGAGNIGATGRFSGSVDFDPGPGVATYTCYGGTDGFAIKLDSSGSFQWVRTYGEWITLNGLETARDLAFDYLGNMFVIGDYQQIVDFDPGPAYEPMAASCSISTFLVKLDVNGNFVWVKDFGGHVGSNASSIGIDKNHNILVAGIMGLDDPSGDFDPGPGTYTLATNGAHDAYVAKIDAAGNFLWARNFGGIGMDFVRSLTIDKNNNVITTGEFFATADFDPSPTAVATMTPMGGGDNFISVISAAGNYLWAGQLKGGGTSYFENGNAVYAASNGALYATGRASGGTDFDPSPASAVISGFVLSAYALKFREVCIAPTAPLDVNSSGKKNVCLNSMATLSVSSINTVSWYSSPSSTLAIGNATTITVNTSSTGVFTYYASAATCTSSLRTPITVTVSACTGINENDGIALIHIAPNPASNELHIDVISDSRIDIYIYDVSGKKLKHQELLGSGNLDITDLSQGIYLMKVISEERELYYRLIVSR